MGRSWNILAAVLLLRHFYTKVDSDQGIPLPQPIISQYNPGTIYGVNTLSNSGSINAIGGIGGVVVKSPRMQFLIMAKAII